LDGLNVRALFDTLEVPWDEETSRQLFNRVLERLEGRERGRRLGRKLAGMGGRQRAAAAR
jgi:hypothetical protein